MILTVYTAISRKVVAKVNATIPKSIVSGFEFTLGNGMRGHGRMFPSAKGKQRK